MKKGYIAGKLFKQGDISQRLYEGALVKKELSEVKFYNPIENGEINEKSNLPTAEEIYYGDTKEVLASDYILAELDDEDPGVIAEIALSTGTNLIKDYIRYIKGIYGNLTIDELMPILDSKIPDKKIYAHLSDIRTETAGKYDGIYVPSSLNQYFVGLLEQYGEIHQTVEGAVDKIKYDNESEVE